MKTTHPFNASSLKLPLLSLVVLGTLGLSACSDQSAKDKEAAENKETTAVDTMKKNATDAKNASADMLDKTKDKATAYGTEVADKAAEYKAAATDKAAEYKDAATDKLTAGKDKLSDMKAKAMDKKSDAEAMLEKAKEKATDGDGGQ